MRVCNGVYVVFFVWMYAHGACVCGHVYVCG